VVLGVAVVLSIGCSADTTCEPPGPDSYSLSFMYDRGSSNPDGGNESALVDCPPDPGTTEPHGGYWDHGKVAGVDTRRCEKFCSAGCTLYPECNEQPGQVYRWVKCHIRQVYPC
jgi:hypothetical protein